MLSNKSKSSIVEDEKLVQFWENRVAEMLRTALKEMLKMLARTLKLSMKMKLWHYELKFPN